MSPSEIMARAKEMARLLGWRAEGFLSNVIRDSGLFISHESRPQCNNNEGGWYCWWSPRLYTGSHLGIDTSHDGLQSHLDLRSFPKLYLSYNAYL